MKLPLTFFQLKSKCPPKLDLSQGRMCGHQSPHIASLSSHFVFAFRVLFHDCENLLPYVNCRLEKPTKVVWDQDEFVTFKTLKLGQ